MTQEQVIDLSTCFIDLMPMFMGKGSKKYSKWAPK